jgi:hypothetical protein
MAMKSPVWEFFSRIDAEDKVLCGLCQSKLGGAQGNTSTMRKHLKRIHDIDLESSKNSKKLDTHQPKLSEFMKMHSKLDPSSPKAIKLTANLSKMLYIDMQPFSFVEDEGFKETMAVAEPRFVIPTRRSFRYNIIPALYNKVAKALRRKIVDYRETYKSHALFSITTDGWTSGSTQSIIAYTMHIINEDGRIESYILSTAEVSSKHTSHNLRAHLLQTLSEWGIFEADSNPPTDMNVVDSPEGDNDGDDDVVEDNTVTEDNGELTMPDIPVSQQRRVVVSTDNAANIKGAIEHSSMHHVRCFAHTINLSVQKFVKQMDDQLAEIRSIVRHFQHSPGACDVIKKDKVSNPKGYKLKIDVSTRWNSSYDMVQRYVEIHCAVYATLTKLQLKDLLKQHNKIDLELLEAATTILKIFKDVTTLMSSQQQVSS